MINAVHKQKMDRYDKMGGDFDMHAGVFQN